jgi:hypothetical protein
MVNCTTDSIEDNEALDAVIVQSEALDCTDDLPKVRLTNNGTHSFDFIVYGDDYSVLHTQNIAATSTSSFIELSNNNVVIVATNDIVYGQKLPLSLVNCDVIELEIDINDALIISGD